ncbi:unnamed protein product [Schistocephalus solidus]|uniref:Uncharacterized protein n=1 Tax=Schistocephalus solidus TaxID=70667 RepID=A0A183TPU6_SCHSO|nr:unnamed protein product [Schistocephalus solidus]
MFSAMLMDNYLEEQPEIRIAYRTDGHLLNSRRMQASTRVSTTTVQDLLFTNDCALNTVTEEDMQRSVWWYTQGRLRLRQPPAPSPIAGLLDSVLTPGSGGGGGESAVAAAQGYYHLKLIHAPVTVPAPPDVEHTVDLVEIDSRTVMCTFLLRENSLLISLTQINLTSTSHIGLDGHLRIYRIETEHQHTPDDSSKVDFDEVHRMLHIRWCRDGDWRVN